MPTWQEVASSVHGALLLARRDSRGLGYFDFSERGFWRSFSAAVLLAPVHILFMFLPADAETAVDMPAGLLAEALLYLAGWAAYPLAMIPVARAFDLGRAYAPYIIAYNWAQVVVMAAWVPVALAGTYLLPQDVASFLSVLLICAVFYYLWFVTRMVLNVPPLMAAGLVLLEFLLTLLVQVGGVTLLGA